MWFYFASAGIGAIVVIILGFLIYVILRLKNLSSQTSADMAISGKTGFSQKEFIFETMQNIKNSITTELRDHQDNTLKLRILIEEQKRTMEKLGQETKILNETLSNNQLRGTYGQEMAEDLLSIVGFIKNVHYITQMQQLDGSRPDITFILPNNTKLNIDVKFPFSAFQRYINTDNENQKKDMLKEFKSDIKDKFKEMKTRDYTNPLENTVDFTIMFIPNEAIFGFVYTHFQDEYQDGLKNKIFMCGPVSFTAILRMIQQFSHNIQYQKNLSKIVKYIKAFECEYEKFSLELQKLGKKINEVNSAYGEVSGVRERQLNKTIYNIKSTNEFPSFEENENAFLNLEISKQEEINMQ